MTTQGVMTEGDYQFLRAQGNNFYAIYMKTFDSPFTPPEVVFTDPEHNATILLDNNCRTTPFVSIVKNTKKGAHLLLTKKLPTSFECSNDITHPCSITFDAYQRRSSMSFIFWIRRTLCPQCIEKMGKVSNCPTACWTFA